MREERLLKGGGIYNTPLPFGRRVSDAGPRDGLERLRCPFGLLFGTFISGRESLALKLLFLVRPDPEGEGGNSVDRVGEFALLRG